jgi:uncharacterized protein
MSQLFAPEFFMILSNQNTNDSQHIIPLLSSTLKLNARSIAEVIKLLGGGNTVPFIARYRKEATGNLDEIQIRSIEERWHYVRELEDRRTTVLDSITSQGKLTDELRAQILACDTKTKLEDLYVPFKPKRRTRAMIAREKGLEPLAQMILEQKIDIDPINYAETFLNIEMEVPDAKTALKGARDIVAEIISEHSELRTFIRSELEKKGMLIAKRRADIVEPTKFEHYYDFKEAVSTIPSHRYLAILRGERENVLSFDIEMDKSDCLEFMEKTMNLNERSPFADELKLSIEDAYKRLLMPSLSIDVRVDLKMKSDRHAIDVFAQNLRHVLLSAPLGAKTVIGIDPGLRTGCKCAVVEDTARFVETVTLFLNGSDDAKERAKRELQKLIEKYRPIAIAVGNGTGGREAETFVKQLILSMNLKDTFVVAVNECGASVYSASDVAREEFPDLDLTIRGAISIARRLQDPLAEMVKVEPKAMGLGQYQHDVYQPLLDKKLGEVVESCVNQVGVELNTASAPLLSYVAGVGPSLAKNIVTYREQNGAFKTRRELLKVSGLGPKTFEQAAGFLRVHGGAHPLDASAVHPESYETVENIARDLCLNLDELIGNKNAIEKIELHRYMTDALGAFTLKDIVEELKKPGRDPRAQFERPTFRDDVNEISDLKKAMILEGIVTNVTAFGAFVDIGVHQDGLVHISELSEQFVKDPSTIVKTGDKLTVEVLDVDIARKRIALSARTGKKRGAQETKQHGQKPQAKPRPNPNMTLGALIGFNKLKI